MEDCDWACLCSLPVPFFHITTPGGCTLTTGMTIFIHSGIINYFFPSPSSYQRYLLSYWPIQNALLHIEKLLLFLALDYCISSPVVGINSSKMFSGVRAMHIRYQNSLAFFFFFSVFTFYIIVIFFFSHQVVRDLGFMIPDILHVLIPLWSIGWQKIYLLPGSGIRKANVRRDLTCMFGLVLLGIGMCSVL